MDLALKIQETAKKLDDSEQLLVLEIMRRFLPDYVATEEDLQDIAVARQELANGETVSHNDIDWD